MDDVDGTPLKIGKADADRTNAAGDPKRMADSERKAQKSQPGAKASQIPNSNHTTTGNAKESEAGMVKSERAAGNKLPLNREKDISHEYNCFTYITCI